jgi:hypothetical protein
VQSDQFASLTSSPETRSGGLPGLDRIVVELCEIRNDLDNYFGFVVVLRQWPTTESDDRGDPGVHDAASEDLLADIASRTGDDYFHR